MLAIFVLLLIGAGYYFLMRKKENLPPTGKFSDTTINPDGSQRMPDRVFWGIIDKTRTAANGDYEQQKHLLTEGLRNLEPREILLFDNTFRHYRGKLYTCDLWSAARIVRGDCSDDSFSDFRGWLIGQGYKTMEAVLANPDELVNLADVESVDWEGLSYCAIIAYQDKTGNEMPMGLRENVDLKGHFVAEEDLQSRFPRLWACYRQEDMQSS